MGLLASPITKESPGAGHHDSIYLSCKLCQLHLPVTAETGRGVPWGGSREDIRKRGRGRNLTLQGSQQQVRNLLPNGRVSLDHNEEQQGSKVARVAGGVGASSRLSLTEAGIFWLFPGFRRWPGVSIDLPALADGKPLPQLENCSNSWVPPVGCLFNY